VPHTGITINSNRVEFHPKRTENGKHIEKSSLMSSHMAQWNTSLSINKLHVNVNESMLPQSQIVKPYDVKARKIQEESNTKQNVECSKMTTRLSMVHWGLKICANVKITKSIEDHEIDSYTHILNHLN